MTDRPDLTLEQIAAALSVHPETVRRWLREGGVFPHAYKLPKGSGWRIPWSDLEAVRRGGRSDEK